MSTESPLKSSRYKLSELVDIKAGYPFRGALKEVLDGGVRAVQTRDISEFGELMLDSMIETELTGKRQPDWLTKEDVLFISKGLRNIACYISDDLESVTCSPSLFILQAKPEWRDKLNMQFLTWQINQAPAQNYLKRTAEGTNQISIRKQTLAETELGVPSIEQQNRIARFYEASINEHHNLQRLIENRKQQMNIIATDLLR